MMLTGGCNEDHSSTKVDVKGNETENEWKFHTDSLRFGLWGESESKSTQLSSWDNTNHLSSPKSISWTPGSTKFASCSSAKSLFSDTIFSDVVWGVPESEYSTIASSLKGYSENDEIDELPLTPQSMGCESSSSSSFSSDSDEVFSELSGSTPSQPIGSERAYASVAQFAYAPPYLTNEEQKLQKLFENRYCERVKLFLENYGGKCRMSLVGEHCPVPKGLPERKKAKQILVASKYDFCFEGMNGNLVVWYQRRKKPFRLLKQKITNSMVNPGQKARLLKFLENK